MRYRGIYTGFLTNSNNGPFVILFSPVILLVEFLSKYSEIFLALYLTAGVYKADPRLSFLSKFLDLTVLFESLTILGVLYSILKKRIKYFFFPKGILLAYIFLIFLGIFSLFYTLAPIYGTDKILRFIFITSPGFFLSGNLFQNRETYVRFIFVFIILAIIMTFDIITGGLTPGEVSFREALGSNYLAVGRISGIAVIFSLSLLFMIKKVFYKICLIFLMGIFTFSMFVSGGRGPLLAFILSVLFIFIYLLLFHLLKREGSQIFIEKKILKLIRYLLLFFILVSFIVFYFHDYFLTIFYRLSLLEELSGASIEERLRLYKSALDAIKISPIVGVGIGGFSVFYRGYDALRGMYPHNIFLEISSELGFLGLFSFLFMILKTILIAFSNIKTSKTKNDFYLSLGLLMTLFFMLINSSISGDINDNRLLFVILGLIYAYRRITKYEEN